MRVEERCSGGEHIFHLFSTPLPRPLLQTHFTISTIVSTSTWKVFHENALYHFYQCANKTHFTISTIVSYLKTHSGEKSKNCCKHTLPFLPLTAISSFMKLCTKKKSHLAPRSIHTSHILPELQQIMIRLPLPRFVRHFSSQSEMSSFTDTLDRHYTICDKENFYAAQIREMMGGRYLYPIKYSVAPPTPSGAATNLDDKSLPGLIRRLNNTIDQLPDTNYYFCYYYVQLLLLLTATIATITTTTTTPDYYPMLTVVDF